MKVIVIGAGAVGLAAAEALARKGQQSVTVLEREAGPGYGASGRNPGAIRTGFDSLLNTLLTQWSLGLLGDLERRSGLGVGFRRHGYLWLASTQRQVEGLQKVVIDLGQRGGLGRWLEPSEAAALVPALDADRLVGAAFFPEDGYLDPHALVSALAQSSDAAGVELRLAEPVLSLRREAEGWTVTTGKSTLPADAVVVAAGAWSASVLASVGVEVPLQPFRRHSFFSGPVSWQTPGMPFTVDAETGAYFRSIGSSMLFGRGREYASDRPTLSTDVDPGAPGRAAAAAAAVVPAMKGASIRFGTAGPYQMTPDLHALLGPVEGQPGLFMACGFSGHGLMHSLITGQLVAEWVVDGAPHTLPEARSLVPSRFVNGQVLEEALQI